MGLEISPSPLVPGFGAAAVSEEELPLLSLNHVSYVCKSVSKSIKFYQDVLGFVLIKRPSSFDFEGAWLFSNGLGIHLLEVEDVPSKKGKINPKDNHISFQTTNMNLLLSRLEDMNIEYVTAVVSDSGITVDQVFFHDPDGYMIEICNCQNFPVLPLTATAACPVIKKTDSPPPPPQMIRSQTAPSLFGNRRSSEVLTCAKEVAASLMMENLVLDMMNFSI